MSIHRRDGIWGAILEGVTQENGEMWIYEGGFPVVMQYEDALFLRNALDQYINLGFERVNEIVDETYHEFESSRRQKKEEVREQTHTPANGYVYLLKEINGPHFKIGVTAYPEDRMKVFAVRLPYRVEYACLIPSADMYALEAELHNKFADKRVDGEWFALSSDDVAYMVGLAEASS